MRKFREGYSSYFVKFNLGRQQRRKTLGKVVRGNLKQMRMMTPEVLAKTRLGIAVVAEARTAAAASRGRITLGRLVAPYLELRNSGDEREPKLQPKNLVEATRHLERSLKPLHGLAINAITRTHVEFNNGKMAAVVHAQRSRDCSRGHFASAMSIAIRRSAAGHGRRMAHAPALILKLRPSRCGRHARSMIKVASSTC
jgi:hypothetical protein